MNNKSDTIQGFKGFDKNLKCRDFQFEIGKTFKHNGKIKACSSGFHFCENPFDVWSYYPPGQNRYCQVKGAGKSDKNGDDSKVSSQSITIENELNLSAFIKIGIDFIFNNASKSDKDAATTGEGANAATTGEGANAATTGEGANAATTGEGANAATTGYRANAATTGEGANAATTGENSIAAGIGINNKAKSIKGNWIVLAEWIQDADFKWQVKTVKTAKIDGKKLKENTWYKLQNGKFVECEEND